MLGCSGARVLGCLRGGVQDQLKAPLAPLFCLNLYTVLLNQSLMLRLMSRAGLESLSLIAHRRQNAV